MSGAIVHEWISRHGGSENVLEAMIAEFPDSDVYSLWNDAPERLSGINVKESWLARTPLRRNKALALPLMPWVWSQVDLSGHDFILVSSHLFAHHIGAKLGVGKPRRYVYVHTPARYIWEPRLDARGMKLGVRALAPVFRAIDSSRAASGATFAANSEYVRKRIGQTWGQDATVIYPPVEVETIRGTPDWSKTLAVDESLALTELPREFVLGASRFVPYKRLDVAIQAGEAVGQPVVLAGSGPEDARLRRLAADASVPVYFVTNPSSAMLYALYQRAIVYVFAAVEDFGIMPVEAMAAGTPVVTVSAGGARESVEMLSGGVVARGLTNPELQGAIRRALEIDMGPVPSLAEMHFGRCRFGEQLREWVLGEASAAAGLV